MATKTDTKTSKTGAMSTAEAGRLGGQKVLRERGPKFYSQIGAQQGKDNNPGNFANRPKDEVREAAAEGGRNSRKKTSAETKK
ncbi:MAG TPA: KGG domain-containing protein [Candidatus Saccharimonadia bacterium]|jgi:general stress protein YciG|nr:KGG domain-containing protein [Candidatus Saccharimonadia bacterium]